MPPAIPDRAPLGDAFTGWIVHSPNQTQALAVLPPAGASASETYIVRYGLRFLGKLHLSIVPGLVVVDYGQMLTGEDAWAFLTRGSNLYPRAEVLGYRNDGRDDMMFVRQLDLAVPVEVLVYADGAATVPVARPTALIAPPDAALAPRLFDYLPRYDSVEAWQTVS